MVDDDRLGVRLERDRREVGDAALPEERADVELLAALREAGDDARPGRARQLLELLDRRVELLLRPGPDRDDDDALALAPRGARRGRGGGEALLELLEELVQVRARGVGSLGARDLEGRRVMLARLLGPELVLARREEVRLPERPWRPVLRDRDEDEEVEACPDEIREVARGRLVAPEGAHDPAQALEPARRAAGVVEPGELDLRRVSDEDVDDLARAVHEDTEAPPDLVGESRELADQVRGGGAPLGDAPPVEALERLELARLEAAHAAEDSRGQGLSSSRSGAPPPSLRTRAF